MGALQLSAGEERVILVMPDLPPAIRRQTLAHELGHILLGHDGESEQANREANCFAAQLLIPRPVLVQLCRRQPQPSLWELSHAFGVARDLLEQVMKYGLPTPSDFTLQESQRLTELFMVDE